MHAVVQAVEALVVALAAAALSHFGVDLKETPRAAPPSIVRKLPVSDPAPAMPKKAPCPQTVRI